MLYDSKKVVVVEEEMQKILIDKSYFERLFIRINPNEKQLSMVTLRLAALLILELSETEPCKLPPRGELAKQMKVSKTTITNSLNQLLESNFMLESSRSDGIRQFNKSVDGDDEVEYIDLQIYEKRKKFTGKYLLNGRFNETEDELNKSIEKDGFNLLRQTGLSCDQIQSLLNKMPR